MISPIARLGARALSKRAFVAPSTTLNTRFSPAARRFIVTKRYTEEHEWVEHDSETSLATMSITKHASASLGDVVFVELPAVGQEITAGDQIGAVESVKAAADIYAPISGIVEEVNTTLGTEPSLLNKSPEDKGWLCKIKATNPAELEPLMNEESYKAFCESA
ncbi:hypothetical protein DL93DRAFT_2079616 [Clavulina sp. PMI_390]|nr:hypothetical protein DL93DRAFT_2079616 [Clavulina sp. PMI_390]